MRRTTGYGRVRVARACVTATMGALLALMGAPASAWADDAEGDVQVVEVSQGAPTSNETPTDGAVDVAAGDGLSTASEGEATGDVQALADDVALETQANPQGISGGCVWSVSSSGRLYIEPSGGQRGTLARSATNTWPWTQYASQITSVKVASGVMAGKDASGMFADLTNAAHMDLSELDTSTTTDMGLMFDNCPALKTLDVSSFDTSKLDANKATGSAAMLFSDTPNLTSFKVGEKYFESTAFKLAPISNANPEGKWWSMRHQRWMGLDALSARVGVADTYTTYEMKSDEDLHVAYRTHVQKDGWQSLVRDGAMSGTSGQAKRLEAIEIALENAPCDGSIEYRTHVQKNGWMDFVSDGAMSGTSGESKRLEAIEIQLTGAMAEHYDVWYRVHAQTYGWLDWAKNGARAGTAGQAKRLEGIEIQLLRKGSSAPGSTTRPYVTPMVMYKTHVQSFGWQKYVRDGALSGTSGKAKRLEGIRIKLIDPQYAGSIEYRTHVQKNGWMDYVRDGAMSGTSGERKRLEAIQIRLTDEMAEHYDVWYRVHAQTFGWMGWAKNGQQAGTAGYAKRLEGIEIQVLPKDSKAPGSTSDHFRSK